MKDTCHSSVFFMEKSCKVQGIWKSAPPAPRAHATSRGGKLPKCHSVGGTNSIQTVLHLVGQMTNIEELSHWE